MCGILGQLSDGDPVSRDRFGAMLQTLSMRGPDGDGSVFLEDDRVALGHRRLAIIDLSDAARQPMSNEDDSIWLTANGEIYNHRELRRELTAAGHRFRSACDCEVILHAYEQWGVDCLDRLRGIFAFGLWDGGRRRLLLARDQLGVKPLYYAQRDGHFTFASQPRAILADPECRREISLDALRDYFAYGYVPCDRAIFDGMSKLAAGHRLLLEDGRVEIDRYWTLRAGKDRHGSDGAAHRIARGLEEAVEAQMMSDVPIGVYLSGGIDSCCIAGIAADAQDGPLRAFTIGFHEREKDERRFAREMAGHAGLDHVVEVLDYETACGLLPEVVEAYDEPFFGGSAFPTLFISQLARRHDTKVILAGDGGDELFAGYRRYDLYAAARHRSWRDRLLGRRAGVADPVASYFDLSTVRVLDWASQRQLFGRRAAGIDADVLWPLRRFFRDDLRPVSAAQHMDAHLYLVDHILCKVDRASMASGVEVRVPILDVGLVETAFALPASVNYRKGERKAALKQAAKRWVPQSLLSNRKKGFSIPLAAWLDRGIGAAGRQYVVDGSLVQRGVLDGDGVREAYDADRSKVRWLLLAAELWSRRWLEGASRDDIDALAAECRETGAHQPA